MVVATTAICITYTLALFLLVNSTDALHFGLAVWTSCCVPIPLSPAVKYTLSLFAAVYINVLWLRRVGQQSDS